MMTHNHGPISATAHDPSLGLAGLKVLVVEDETIVYLLLEDMLLELSCTQTWHASNVRRAVETIGEQRPDLAVLDVNLGGELVYPVASLLEAEGIPYIFATGYGRSGIPPQWAHRLVIQKPFTLDTLAAAIACARKTGAPAEDGAAE